MENIHKIITYFSGEMSPEEEHQFLLEKSSSPELEALYREIETIWNEARSALETIPKGDLDSKEAVIAEILAEYDIERYGREPVTRKQKQFSRELRGLLDSEQTLQEGPVARTHSLRRLTVITLLAAASLAIAILVVLPKKDFDYLLQSYYQPTEDPALVLNKINYRGEVPRSVVCARNGDFLNTVARIREELPGTAQDTSTLTLYAIALYETGQEHEAVMMLDSIMGDLQSENQLRAAWYRALILLKSGNLQDGRSALNAILDRKSYFASRASKLLMKME